jgi:hypothetical protein
MEFEESANATWMATKSPGGVESSFPGDTRTENMFCVLFSAARSTCADFQSSSLVPEAPIGCPLTHKVQDSTAVIEIMALEALLPAGELYDLRNATFPGADGLAVQIHNADANPLDPMSFCTIALGDNRAPYSAHLKSESHLGDRYEGRTYALVALQHLGSFKSAFYSEEKCERHTDAN